MWPTYPTYFIILKAKMAYFNTTVTTNSMVNTRNVTFKQPHTRQMQLPMPSLLLPTISFTLFRFSSKLSILSTSSGTFVVEAAAMVEEADRRYPLSRRNTTYSSSNQYLEHVPGTCIQMKTIGKLTSIVQPNTNYA
jgi:hypothetical protein